MAETLSLTFYPSSFDDDHKYYSVNSSYPVTNPIGKPSSNTTYSQINLSTGSSAETYFYYKFDLSAIPYGATISSVSCSYKAYISTTNASYITTRAVQLYSGSTAKGSAGTITTSTNEQSLTTGNWTYDELQNARIRLYAKRGSSRTSNTYYIRFYGATLNVEYEDNAQKYNVTVTCNDGIHSDKDGDNTVRENDDFEISITGNVGVIIDNGVNVTANLTEKTAPDNETATRYPAGYTVSGSISGTKYQNAVGKGASNTESGNDYCSSSGSTATIFYSFDFTDIPEDATVISVAVTVGGHLESTSNSSEVARLQLYSGNTTKGETVSFTSTSKQLIDMTTGSWTRDELQEAKLGFTIGYYGGLVNGVDFMVVYTTPRSGGAYYVYTISSVNKDHLIIINAGGGSTNLRIKVNGSYVKVSKVYLKVDGKYILKSTNDLPSDVSWVKG